MTTLQDAPNASSDADDYFLVAGEISAIYHGVYVADVIESVQRAASRAKDHVLENMVQKLAPWRQLFTGEFDDGTYFAMALGADVVCGKFEGARYLRDGDHIAAVVARDGERLYAHGIRRTGDDLLLIDGETAGPGLAVKEFVKSVVGTSCLMLPVYALPVLLAAFLGGVRDLAQFCWMLAGCYVFVVLLLFRLDWDAHRAARGPRKRAAAIYRLFGFPHPDYFNAKDGMAYFGEGASRFWGMNCALALAKQRKPKKSARIVT